MITGIGTPISQSRSPRPIVFSIKVSKTGMQDEISSSSSPLKPAHFVMFEGLLVRFVVLRVSKAA